MVKKAHQNPKGGLNKAGRAHFKAKGQNLKAPVKSGDNPRRASYLARMAGVKGPMMKNGKPRQSSNLVRKDFLSSIAVSFLEAPQLSLVLTS